MTNYNPIILEGKSRSMHAKDWMFEFCRHHDINAKVLPFLINYMIYYCDRNYDILEATDNAPTLDNNRFELSTSVKSLCDAMMGLSSRSRMQDTLLPSLEKTGFITLVKSNKSGRIYMVDFDVLNTFLSEFGCYKKNNRLLQKEQPGCYKKNNHSLYIKEDKRVKDELPKIEEEIKVENEGLDPDALAMEIEHVITKNRKLDRARRKLMLSNPNLDIDSFKKSFSHWLVHEYSDFELHDDGRGLESLMKTHIEFLATNGPSSSYKKSTKGFGRDKADKLVDWMLENAADLQMDEFGCRYTFYANGDPRPSELFFKEKEEIQKGLRSGAIKEKQLRFYTAYILVRKQWPDYNHSYFFCEYDFDDSGSVMKYRAMMKSLSGYVANQKGKGNFIELAKDVYGDY